MTVPEWMRLENSAIIYPSCQTRKYSAVYRMSATLDTRIEPDILDAALKGTIARFPGFRYTVKKGVFWWFLRKLENEPGLSAPASLQSFDISKGGGYMFRLSCSGRRIDLDVFHALTDGTGAMTFLLSITAEYLRRSCGAEIDAGKWVLSPESEAAEEELEDSFDRFSGIRGNLDDEKVAYHIKGTEEKSDILNSLGVSVSSKALKAKAAEMDCTVTELLSAIMLYSLQEVRRNDPAKRKSPHLRMELPVNLRGVFGSKTLRNFSSYVYLGIDVTNGDLGFEHILSEVKYQKRLYTQPGRLTKRIAANVALEDNLAIRCIPLFIKKPVINLINHLKGDRYASYTFSNLGKIELPEGMQKHVTDLHFVLGRTRGRSGSCACVSLGDIINLDFTRKIAEDGLERIFVRELRALGIWATVHVPSPALKPAAGWNDTARPVFRKGPRIPRILFSI